MTTEIQFESSEAFARRMDERDPLARFRSEFLFPRQAGGEPCVYLVGNSLGLQPRKAREYIQQELEDWEKWGVEGHFHARRPWFPYHENLTEQTARLVGAKPLEVVVMNTLTVNLHLMMVSFYRPTPQRYRILIEGGAFPSDRYAVASQARLHGYDPSQAVLELMPRGGESCLRTEDILETIEREGDSIALVLLGSVNYLTGQAFEIPAITRAAHAKGCSIGFDLAHGAGNLLLRLHEWGPDFAVWCGYKYLNAGPGALSGCFVHERHARSPELPRFAGWWGHDKAIRFQMGPKFLPIEGAEGWQLSNPPIFQMAALRASLEIFDAATMAAIRQKSLLLTGYLEYLLDEFMGGAGESACRILTPRDPEQRGAQLSLKMEGKPGGSPREAVKKLTEAGVICDFREPDVIRVAPAPLYCRFEDVHRFVKILGEHARG